MQVVTRRLFYARGNMKGIPSFSTLACNFTNETLRRKLKEKCNSLNLKP
jgi:hypothetical protein